MPKFIAFEGCEGVGKSTQLRMLRDFLVARGVAVECTREPGGTETAEMLREIILRREMSAECEAALFAAARSEHIDGLILPALAAGKTVLCDRYVDSSVAYQGFGRGLGRRRVEELNRYALERCMPDGVVFIDQNPLESWRRKSGKTIENDRMEAENARFHLEVYRGFLELCETEERFIRIEPDEDKAKTAEIIRERLMSRGLI